MSEYAGEKREVLVLWARMEPGYGPSAWPQFVAAFPEGMVDAWSELYEEKRREAEEFYAGFGDVGVAEFFTTWETLRLPKFPEPAMVSRCENERGS